ncbi:hypothetical protein [Mucilaginibacter pedocola]|nr:hypothetical protein [Mucilaginibacter pedocola]
MAGQICQISNLNTNENSTDVYIITEDPAPFKEGDEIRIVKLRDLQRSIRNPSAAPHITVRKSDLNVIADNLEEYIKSWNN